MALPPVKIRAALGMVLLGVGVLLSGCAAALSLFALESWFKSESPDQYQVYVNGYNLSSSPSITGDLNLAGLGAGDYLISVSRIPDMTRGVEAIFTVVPGKTVSLKVVNPFDGGVITGTVRQGSSGGALLGNTLVVAVHEGAALLTAGGAPITIPPAAGSLVQMMMGYTDNTGSFQLGPALYGNWLVTSAAAGYCADVKFTSLSSGTNGSANLVLAPDPSATSGMVTGSVTSTGGTPLGGALVTGKLTAAFFPTIPDATRSQVASASGLSLPGGPWFQWQFLTALASGSGVYNLNLPAGSQQVQAFRLSSNATTLPAGVTSGGTTSLNFRLPGA